MRKLSRGIGFLSVFLLLQIIFTVKLIAQQILVTDTFHYTGTTQTFVIPACANIMTVELTGASGGFVSNIHTPGPGGYIDGVLTPTPGTLLYLTIGGTGMGRNGGFNGGGNGGQGISNDGTGGGGATDIRLGGNALTNRIVVAGGGGGGGGGGPLWGSVSSPCFGGMGGNYYGWYCGTNGVGGQGGVGIGTSNGNMNKGGCAAGTATWVGAGGAGAGVMNAGGLTGSGNGSYGQAGALGVGGNGGGNLGTYGGGGGGIIGAGGGGAGYYGGAGGMSQASSAFSNVPPLGSGGGGGSSYADPVLFSSIGFGGIGNSNGMIVIKYFSLSITSTSMSICSGANTTLTATGMLTYTWHPAGTFGFVNTPTVVVNPTASTVYTVSGTNTHGCVSQSIIAVTTTSSPVVTIAASPSETVCPGEMIILTAATNANTYLWTNSVNSLISSVPSFVIYPNVSATYSVRCNTNGCVSENLILITVNECTSLLKKNKESGKIKVYPNPTNGMVTVQSASDLTLKLVNELGEVLKIIRLNAQNEWQMPVSDLPKGIYFLTGTNGESKINQKLVIIDN